MFVDDGIRHKTTRFFYRRYKNGRRFFSNRRPDVFTRLFFGLRERLQRLTAVRKISKQNLRERRIWKAIYFHRFGTEPLFVIQTNHPVATDSADHKWPKGTIADNSSNRNFNLKLYAHFNYRSDLRVLDLGCSGGGFVKSFLEDGYVAVGVEGSDWSKKLRSAESDTIPHHLLTGDITAPFNIERSSGEPMRFHCVTAWEVLEHIPTEKLPFLIENITQHLAPDGIFVASVDTAPDSNPVTGAVYHVTLQPKRWWLDQFERCGLFECDASVSFHLN